MRNISGLTQQMRIKIKFACLKLNIKQNHNKLHIIIITLLLLYEFHSNIIKNNFCILHLIKILVFFTQIITKSIIYYLDLLCYNIDMF